jgi:small membrane protein
MILISILTIIFVFMAFYSVLFIHRIVVRYVLVLTYTLAIFFVWNQEATTVIANFFGIGRGLDFVLTLFSVVIVNGIFFIVSYMNSQHQSITKLTRYIAISDARLPASTKSQTENNHKASP